MTYDKIVSLGIFAVAYVLFVMFPSKRSIAAIGGAALLLALRVMDPAEAFGFISWNVMGIFVGMLVMAELLMQSNMPAVLAESLVARAPRAWVALLMLCGLSGFISMWAENVATVMLIAPIAFEVARKLNISPVPLLVGVTVSANLQGSATLIGDSPSMILAGQANMGFNDFFFTGGRLSIFFFVEAGAVLSFFVLYFFYRKYNAKIHLDLREQLKNWTATILMVTLILALIASSFYFVGTRSLAGILCLIWAAIGLLWYKWKGGAVVKLVRTFDWDTAFFLVGVFVLVGALSHAGWIDDIAKGIASMTGGSRLGNFVLLMAISVAVSAFVDNIPYILAMIPVAQKLAGDADPRFLLFGLLIATCIGGNITPIGASANVVTVGYLRKSGHPVTFFQFMKIGLPFTVVATATAGAFLWIVWG